jgi:hypothetical protein
MRQNPNNVGLPTSAKVKHLFLENADSQTSSVEYVPFFYVEARIDFNDVRTGFRLTASLNKALEIYAVNSDLIWSEDMIQDVDPQIIKASAPAAARLRSLPDFIDVDFMHQMELQFIQYLLRSYKARIYRNSELDVYSGAGESLSEFTARCLDLLDGSKRRELDVLHEVFKRKLERIKQKYLDTNVSDNLDLVKIESQSRDFYFQYSERIAGLFLQPELGLNIESNSLHVPRKNLELEERLLSLELEARQAIAKLWDSNNVKAQSIDEYILHPNLKDLHFVRSCILWIPAKAA